MKHVLHELSELILWINRQGWSPATSTNYSHRDQDNDKHCYISRSGVDKSRFTAGDFLLLSLEGELLGNSIGQKTSAETGIHLMLYQNTDAQCVLHTHSKADTLLSRFYARDGAEGLTLAGYELLKGLAGINTHECSVVVPIFANNQDITALSSEMQAYLQEHPDCRGMFIESHGFYTWGGSLPEAKRHLEVFQFLFDCELDWLRLRMQL